MNQRYGRNVLFISLSQFGIAFSFNFVMVFIPFYINKMSPYSSQQTLVWVGLIMGASSFMAAMASTFWGTLASRFNPKLLFMRGLLSHSILIFLMGFVTSLPLLLAIRMVQGILGGISTIGLIMVSSSSSSESAAGDIGLYQNSLTFGQLLGPPVGAYAAFMLGYKGAFIFASVLVFVTLVFCFFFVKNVQQTPTAKGSIGKPTPNKKIFIAWAICFTGTVQLMFLPGILPNVFDSMAIDHSTALKWSGVFVMAYTFSAMIGTYFLCRLAPKLGNERLIVWAGGLGAFLQLLFVVCPDIWSFVAIRLVQTALIAGLLPLIISLFTSELNGRVIGFLNASRFAGNAIGPVIATSILASSNLSWVNFSISGLSILSVAGFYLAFRRTPSSKVIS